MNGSCADRLLCGRIGGSLRVPTQRRSDDGLALLVIPPTRRGGGLTAGNSPSFDLIRRTAVRQPIEGRWQLDTAAVGGS